MESMSAIREFYQQLFDSGQVGLTSSAPASDEELADVVELLIALEVAHREHLPGPPPATDRPSVAWAAAMFFAAAQLAVYRELGEQEIDLRLRKELTTSASPASTAYSVDLIFRRLPDLVRIVRGINRDDPLVSVLLDWCRRWPLSSAGISDVGEIDIEPILSDRCLALMYTDRVLDSGDVARTRHPGMAEWIRGAVGAWPELSPEVRADWAHDN